MSARETPSIRIVFRNGYVWADLSRETDLLNTNLMWDVRKALPVTVSRTGFKPVGFDLAGHNQTLTG